MTVAYRGPWFCVVDPELEGMTQIGHYQIYDRMVCEAAERLGYSTLILGRKTFNTTHLGATPVIPAFTYGIWESSPADYNKDGGHRRRMRVAWRFFRESRAALALFHLKSDSFVFFQSVSSLQIPGLAFFGLWCRLVRGPKVVIFLRYQHWLYDHLVSAFGFRILEMLVWAGQVRFVTDSQGLVEDYRALTRAPIHVVPIPHAQIRARPHAANRDRHLRFGTLGGARAEKGIGDFIDAIGLLNHNGLASNMQFFLYVHSPSPDEILQKFNKLKEQAPNNVTLIENPLDDDEYADLLNSLDVLALPYWRSTYRSRTSGILAEGIASGKVAIVTRGTWLEDEMNQSGAGVACEDRSPADLARAILETAARFEELHAVALARRPAVSEHDKAEELVTLIVNPFSIK